MDRPERKSNKINHSERHLILGIGLDPISMGQALDNTEKLIVAKEPHYIVTPNLHFVALAEKDRYFREAVNHASLSLADGMPLIWYARLKKIKMQGRVNGTDFVYQLSERLAKTSWPIFLLGASEENNAMAARQLKSMFPGLDISGGYSPPFSGFDQDEERRIVEKIRNSGARVVFVAFSDPARELWMEKNFTKLGPVICIGIGGALDFIAGDVRRAPLWMQRNGLEWLFRVIVEPRRLAKRYAKDSFIVAKLIIKDITKRTHQ